MGIRREYDSVGKGDLSETENEKSGKWKKDKRYFEISMIRQIPLNRTESNQPSLSPYQIVLIWFFFFFNFWLWFVGVIVVVVIIVSHLFLSIVLFCSSCPLLFEHFKKTVQIAVSESLGWRNDRRALHTIRQRCSFTLTPISGQKSLSCTFGCRKGVDVICPSHNVFHGS